MKYVYTLVGSGRGEFHTYDVRRAPESSHNGLIVASYKWKHLAEQVAKYLAKVDEQEEFLDRVSNGTKDSDWFTGSV